MRGGERVCLSALGSALSSWSPVLYCDVCMGYDGLGDGDGRLLPKNRVWEVSSQRVFFLTEGDCVRLTANPSGKYFCPTRRRRSARRAPCSFLAKCVPLAPAVTCRYPASYGRCNRPLGGSHAQGRVQQTRPVVLHQKQKLPLLFLRFIVPPSSRVSTPLGRPCHHAGQYLSRRPKRIAAPQPLRERTVRRHFRAQAHVSTPPCPSSAFPTPSHPPIAVLGPPSCSIHVDAEPFKCPPMHPVVRSYRELGGRRNPGTLGVKGGVGVERFALPTTQQERGSVHAAAEPLRPDLARVCRFFAALQRNWLDRTQYLASCAGPEARPRPCCLAGTAWRTGRGKTRR